MADKVLHTRIKLLSKTYSDWQSIATTFIPLAGEVCIVSVPASTGAVVQEPAILFKVGDGTSTFAKLEYVSAKAADVYNWAKKSSLDWNDLDETFKEALKEYVSESDTLFRLASDGDYKWKLEKSEDGGTTWTDAEGAKIDVSTMLDNLAAIAKTGNVNDLVQTDGDVLILDCNV